MNLASTILKYDHMCMSMTPTRERYSVYFLVVGAELAPGQLCQVPLPLPESQVVPRRRSGYAEHITVNYCKSLC